jgi:hypothetical protein
MFAAMASIAVVAQERTSVPADSFRNELGIDMANVLTFLSKKSESYLVNYKRHLRGQHVLRSGLNFEWSTSNDGYKGIGLRLGYERQHPIANEHWRLHWGADASYSYRSNNFQPNRTMRGGLHPLIGFSFLPVPQFAIGTEVCLNLFYTDRYNPDSFDPEDNKPFFDTDLSSVGMVIITCRF